MNTGKLAGKTIFVTGASRGIGLTFALKAARDGANIIIAAKTAEPHPKLPGTIYTAAKEIENAGGKCLPCIVDVRDEGQVEEAVSKAVKQFGGIDVLFNNASAISLTGTLDTSMKKYDLMNSINARGTYLVSQKCIPYLKQAKNPHILMNSPPLNMKPIWFKYHTAYTMAKYGMSMCVLGMAEELKPFGIAVNAIWPRTAIYTAAMEFLGGQDVGASCRKSEIVADAAYSIVTRDSRNFTGNFCIDEDVLKETGMEDFSVYAVQPGHPLTIDFFLEGAQHPFEQEAKIGSGSKSASQSSVASTGGDSVPDALKGVSAHLGKDLVEKIQACYAFKLTGNEPGTWYVDLRSDSGSYGEGEPPNGKANITITLDSADFVKMLKGSLQPASAFFAGKIKLDGPMNLALKLDKLLEKTRSSDKSKI